MGVQVLVGVQNLRFPAHQWPPQKGMPAALPLGGNSMCLLLLGDVGSCTKYSNIEQRSPRLQAWQLPYLLTWCVCAVVAGQVTLRCCCWAHATPLTRQRLGRPPCARSVWPAAVCSSHQCLAEPTQRTAQFTQSQYSTTAQHSTKRRY
jgi:hypothetical protein